MPTITDANRSYKLPTRPTADQLIALACEILAGRHQVGTEVPDPTATKQMLQLRIGDENREVVHALFLDSRGRLIHEETLLLGTISRSPIFPRVVVRAALACDALGCVIAHNHVRDYAYATGADIEITRELRKTLELINVRLLDHIVVSRTDALSFAERGLLL
ncbi:DNA repair protein RadC [Stenotrophomonas maltophilia]|nr:DNA repair protein RadC [Stenotrophomonas maltophilia]